MYPGEDENASGTATVMALAQSLAASRPPRTLIFALFSGEEIGLVGSDYQVRHPSVVPTDRMAAMVNFDMLGRLEGRHLMVVCVDTVSGFLALVEYSAREVGLDVSLRPSGTCPSDHSRFNYDDLQRAAKVVVDTRNAIPSPGPHVVRLGAPRPVFEEAAAAV